VEDSIYTPSELDFLPVQPSSVSHKDDGPEPHDDEGRPSSSSLSDTNPLKSARSSLLEALKALPPKNNTSPTNLLSDISREDSQSSLADYASSKLQVSSNSASSRSSDSSLRRSPSIVVTSASPVNMSQPVGPSTSDYVVGETIDSEAADGDGLIDQDSKTNLVEGVLEIDRDTGGSKRDSGEVSHEQGRGLERALMLEGEEHEGHQEHEDEHEHESEDESEDETDGIPMDVDDDDEGSDEEESDSSSSSAPAEEDAPLLSSDEEAQFARRAHAARAVRAELRRDATRGDFSSDEEEMDQGHVPQDGTYSMRYSGHRNLRTVKEVSFLSPTSAFVASGSDDGRIFIWDKRTGQLRMLMKGDNEVVNCVQSHPTDMLIATSGIENDIKLWAPKNFEHDELPDKKTIMKRNRQRQRSQSSWFTHDSEGVVMVPRAFLQRLLGIQGANEDENGDCEVS